MPALAPLQGGEKLYYTTAVTYHKGKAYIGSLRANHISVLDVSDVRELGH